MMWAVERADGGRGFGFTGGHFHDNWGNDDYRKVAGTQGDGDGVDVEIEFCLASSDPNGGSTSGINRVDGTGTCSGGDCYQTVGITSTTGTR